MITAETVAAVMPERESSKFRDRPNDRIGYLENSHTVEDPFVPYAPSHYRIKLLAIESLIELWLAIINYKS